MDGARRWGFAFFVWGGRERENHMDSGGQDAYYVVNSRHSV